MNSFSICEMWVFGTIQWAKTIKFCQIGRQPRKSNLFDSHETWTEIIEREYLISIIVKQTWIGSWKWFKEELARLNNSLKKRQFCRKAETKWIKYLSLHKLINTISQNSSRLFKYLKMLWITDVFLCTQSMVQWQFNSVVTWGKEIHWGGTEFHTRTENTVKWAACAYKFV